MMLAGAALVLGLHAIAARQSLAGEDLSNGATAADLANALVGTGISSITGVVYTGDQRAAGSFSGAASIIGFGSGIVLSTGNVQTIGGDPSCGHGVEGPNGCRELNPPPGNSTDFSGPGDSDLTALLSTILGSSATTHDAAILEFDFTPQFSTLSLQYVFSSEDYNDFLDTTLIDVLGIFIDGVNCALVPGTATPVSVNSINNGSTDGDVSPSHPELYRDNVRPSPSINTEMDGLTTVLTCTASVTPGQKHHIKLAIADGNDGGFDSAVFVKSGSLVSSDVTPPDTSIMSGPSGTITANSASFTSTGTDHVT